jgi:hypothetical protein
LFPLRELRIFLGGKFVDTGVTDVEDRTWKHICVTWSSQRGRLKLYTDGLIRFDTVFQKGLALPRTGLIVLGQNQLSASATVPVLDESRAFHGNLEEVCWFPPC